MEAVGVHKREILSDRVVDARVAQNEAKEQFTSALEQFKSVVPGKETSLEKVYKRLNNEYEKSKEAADEIHDRVDAIESVGDALFDEWNVELKQYSSSRLREDSKQKMNTTKKRYEQLLVAMRKTESRLKPVLTAMNDNVLYLKHNLNSQAILSLKEEVVKIDRDVDELLIAIKVAIEEADAFISEMKKGDM